LARQQNTSPKATDFFKELSNYSAGKALNPPSHYTNPLHVYLRPPPKKTFFCTYMCIKLKNSDAVFWISQCAEMLKLQTFQRSLLLPSSGLNSDIHKAQQDHCEEVSNHFHLNKN
jgi:hypothetical protein